ncbi:MAG: BLUF domain-containing protein [Proteobacteria bacterium]|nr:BLUF domain-containing protein [Pseudomonadota bacterium]
MKTIINKKIDLFQIVYKSTSKHLIGSKEIETILEVARRKNEQNGVTGLLMVRGKVFIQLLEGDRKAVEDT